MIDKDMAEILKAAGLGQDACWKHKQSGKFTTGPASVRQRTRALPLTRRSSSMQIQRRSLRRSVSQVISAISPSGRLGKPPLITRSKRILLPWLKSGAKIA